MSQEKPRTVPAVALTNFAFFGTGTGTSRHVERGEAVDWPADDFDRAQKNGLIRPADQKAK